MFCRECTRSIQKTHTKRMSNRIRSRSYWRIKESIRSIQVQLFKQPLWRRYHRIWKHTDWQNDGGKRKRWEKVITSTNMTHNSRKAWKTIRKLSNDPTTSNPPCLVSANQVAHQLLVNGRGTMPSKPKRPILRPATEGDYSMVYPFSKEE